MLSVMFDWLPLHPIKRVTSTINIGKAYPHLRSQYIIMIYCELDVETDAQGWLVYDSSAHYMVVTWPIFYKCYDLY